jgi:hypothetical protein
VLHSDRRTLDLTFTLVAFADKAAFRGAAIRLSFLPIEPPNCREIPLQLWQGEYFIGYITPFTSFSFNAKEMAQLVSGKMPAITNTVLFCYYDPQKGLWVEPVQMVMGTL